MTFEIIITIAVLFSGLYMLGIGYKYIPDPGKRDSIKNKEHFDKYRKLFKTGGILSLVYVVLQTTYIALGYVV